MIKRFLVKCSWRGVLLTLLLSSTLVIISAFLYSETERKEKTQLILRAMGTRVTADFVQPTVNTILLEPDQKSRRKCNHAFSVILVTSKPKDIARRNAIRETWARWQNEFDSVVYFFTGATDEKEIQELESESQLFGDLIVDELQENKYRLTVKSLRLLKWFIKNCPRAQFLIKADDDAFLNLPVLHPYLQALNYSTLSQGFIGGLVHEGRAPHNKNPFSKWYVPPEMWEKGIYPPYIDSICTIISGKIVSHLFMASFQVPLFHISEIFLTGIVASQYLQMELADIPHIYDGNWPSVNYFLKSEAFLKTNVAYHCSHDGELMRKLYWSSWRVHERSGSSTEDIDIIESS